MAEDVLARFAELLAGAVAEDSVEAPLQDLDVLAEFVGVGACHRRPSCAFGHGDKRIDLSFNRARDGSLAHLPAMRRVRQQAVRLWFWSIVAAMAIAVSLSAMVAR